MLPLPRSHHTVVHVRESLRPFEVPRLSVPLSANRLRTGTSVLSPSDNYFQMGFGDVSLPAIFSKSLD